MREDSRFAVFDLDGTLTKKDTYIPFLMNCAIKCGLRNLSIFLLPCHILAFKVGLISNEKLKEKFLNAFLGGVKKEKLNFVTRQFVEQLIKKGMRREIVNILHQCRERGDHVILASASFDFYVEEIAERLKVDKIICTRAEIQDQRITGRIADKNCYGNEKARRVLEYFAQFKKKDFIVYTDHYSDLPLIQKASAVYIVDPGHKTRRFLENRGYKIDPMAGMPSLSRLRMC